MKRLCWLTDPHFNFLSVPNAALIFGQYLRAEQEFDAVVITGDIAEAPTVQDSLKGFAKGVGLPVYFTLGNHDFYYGGFESVYKDVGELDDKNLTWIDKSAPIVLDENTVLTGHQGWFDGILGKAKKSDVILSDFSLIQELRELYNPLFWNRKGERAKFLAYVEKLGKQAAEEARVKLLQAAELRETIIFATHFSPFKESCWHEGAISDSRWLPWFTCDAMGKMLLEVASNYPKHKILVLCGHTHSPGVYQPRPNLGVLTGKAVYGAPDISGIISTPVDFKAFFN